MRWGRNLTSQFIKLQTEGDREEKELVSDGYEESYGKVVIVQHVNRHFESISCSVDVKEYLQSCGQAGYIERSTSRGHCHMSMSKGCAASRLLNNGQTQPAGSCIRVVFLCGVTTNSNTLLR